tara:strand:- start:4882 stop:8007 length:3126 start_codon:yes stop_codon:yes gene_type:complete
MVFRYFLFCLIFNLILSQFDWIENGAPIRQGQHIEWQRTAGDGEPGQIIFAWSDTRDSMRDVYVQKIDAQGNKLWGEKGIAVTTAYGRQEDPLLVGDDNGGAFIIWIDYRDEPDTKGDVYAQHILSDGSLVWSLEGQPIVVKDGAQRNPNMCKDGNGGAYIIWKDFTVGQYEHVYATHISSDNEIINPGEGIPIMTNDSHHNGISLEIAGLGEAAMAWVDDRNGNLDIFGQRIVADHDNDTITTLWSTAEEGGVAICDAEGDQNYAKITYAAGCCGTEGITVTTWQDDRNQNFDIYMQYLWVNGDPYFQEYPQGLPLTEGLVSSQTKPRVKADDSGAYVVWYSDQNGNSDIYAQKIIASQDDPIAWSDGGLAICTAEDAQTGARLSTSGYGGAYFTWQDDRNGGDEADVYIQHVSSENMTTMPENGLVISNASLIQKSPVVRKDGSGSAFIIWEDGRSGSGGIYVQHLNSQGDLTLSDNGMEIYYGVDGKSENIKATGLNNSEALLYWEDHENGVNSTYNFGKIISNDYGASYDNAISIPNTSLSENPAQLNAEIKKVDDKLFMGFLQDNYQAGVDPFEGYSQYFQILDLADLSLIGDSNGTWLNPTDSYQYDFISEFGRDLDLLVNEDNSIFYFTSLSEFFAGPDIYVRKVGIDGQIYWDAPKNLTNNPSSDNFVKKVFNVSDGGAFIVFDQIGSGNYGNISIINSDAENYDNFPKRVCDIESDQFIEDAVDTGNGIFVIWRDNRQEGGSDIYGQYFDYSGNTLGDINGVAVATYDNDQTNARVTFHHDLNEVLVCWEDYSNGQDYDLACNTVDLDTFEVNFGADGSPLYMIASGQGDQINIYPYTALNGNYMIAWEDSRNNSDENLQTHTDIYYQEIDSNGDFIYESNGIVVCDAYHIQTEPKIDLYSKNVSDQSYLIYWSDLRSTGKDLLYNIYGQSITHDYQLSIDSNIEQDFSISSIYPNPFNPEVNISFFNPKNNQVSVKIYDLNGRLVDTLYDNFLNTGLHAFTWNGKNNSSGIYIVTIESENSYISSKMSLLK